MDRLKWTILTPYVVHSHNPNPNQTLVSESTRVMGDATGLKPTNGINTLSIFVRAESKIPAGIPPLHYLNLGVLLPALLEPSEKWSPHSGLERDFLNNPEVENSQALR